MDRRAFLATAGGILLAGCSQAGSGSAAADTGAAAAAAAAGPAPPPGAARPLGLQLYTLRGEMERDVAATLRRVAEIGYREVEFAGYFGRSPAEVRDLLAATGLAAPASHVPWDRVGGDWAAALDEARAIGHRYVVVPWLQASDFPTAASWRDVARRLDEAGAAAREAGLVLGYHNHDFEFRTVDGVVPFDVLLAETSAENVVFELDLYWTVRAGRDPLAYFRDHPGRFRLVHVKDSAGAPDHRMTEVGAGSIDFGTILPAAATAGVEHFFVEHDDPADPMASVRTSFENLRRIEF